MICNFFLKKEKDIRNITNSFSFFKKIKRSEIFRRFYLFLKQYDIFCLFIAFWQKKKLFTKSKTMNLSFASKRKDKGKVYKFWLSIQSSPQYHFYKLWNSFKNLYYFLKVVKRINVVKNKKARHCRATLCSVVTWTGFEPVNASLKGMWVNHFSTRPWKNGAYCRTRTYDLPVNGRLLYQLS